MKISIIVAIDKNNAIGKDNKLLCHISEDLKRFKAITNEHCVIMGRNTYLSLPNRPLKNRKNIVISHLYEQDKIDFEGAVVVPNIEEAIKAADHEKENFIIGGAMVYEQFFTLADKLYLTVIHREYDADTFFPKIKIGEEWDIIDQELHFDNEPPFKYLTLLRKKMSD